MPPKVRFGKEQILNAAFDLVKEQGMDALNARAIAQRMGCSTQPLFRVFSSIDEIQQRVLEMAQQAYIKNVQDCMHLDIPPYKKSGMAYLLFARNFPQLFILLFMEKSNVQQSSAFTDVITEPVISAICQATGYDHDLALRLHRHVWIFTHGLASMIATQVIPYDDEQISSLLTECYLSIRARYDEEQKAALHPSAE